MALEHLHEKRRDILDAIESAIIKALSDCSQHEPQLVANLVYHIPRAINEAAKEWKKAAGVDIRSGGIFVHQTPKVKVRNFPENGSKSVEIGDLLFLMTHKRWNGTIDRSSLLFQAKKAKRIPTDPDNMNQHHLYAYWPEYEYVRSGPSLNGRKRKVTGPHLYAGAKYLILCIDDIFNHPCWVDKQIDRYVFCASPAVTAHPSYPKIYRYSCFICELYEFIFGNTGRVFTCKPGKNNTNWDQVMTDLIEETAIKSMPKTTKVPGSEGKRGQFIEFVTGEMISFLSGNLAMQEWNSEASGIDGPPEVPGREFDGGDGNGISIIEFIIEDHEPGEQD